MFEKIEEIKKAILDEDFTLEEVGEFVIMTRKDFMAANLGLEDMDSIERRRDEVAEIFKKNKRCQGPGFGFTWMLNGAPMMTMVVSFEDMAREEKSEDYVPSFREGADAGLGGR